MRQGAASTRKLGGPLLAGEPRLLVYAGSARAWQGSDDAIGVFKHGFRRNADNTGTSTTKQPRQPIAASSLIPSRAAAGNAGAVSACGRLKGIEEIRCALRVAGGSEDRTVIVLQNFQPVG